FGRLEFERQCHLLRHQPQHLHQYDHGQRRDIVAQQNGPKCFHSWSTRHWRRHPFSNADIVQLANAAQLGSGAAVTINSSGLFDANGITESFDSLAGSGNVHLGGANISFGFDGTSTTFSGVFSEAGNITKFGSGTMTLNGNNTHAGTTT